MAKVQKITVSNLKALSEMTANFNGCTAIITGGNNKGKSSFLKSLPERLRGQKPEMILKQGEREGFAEWELTTGEKFLWNFDGKKEKLTFISERNIKGAITKDLTSYYFPPIFNVDEFLNSTPAKQKAILQKLTGIDFTEIDRLYKEAYENRSYANKRVAEDRARLTPIDKDFAKEPYSTDELKAKISGLGAHELAYKNKGEFLKQKQQAVADNESEIAELKGKIASIQQKNSALNGDIFELEAWMEDEANTPKSKEEIELLNRELELIEDENKLIAENNKSIERDNLFQKIVLEAQELDKEVKRIEAEKLDVIKNASMPEGFGFNNEGITYNGFAFNRETLSSSGIYIAALKLAALGLGEVKTLHFDASFLDKKSLAEIEQWANEQDLQLLIERPDFDGGEIEYQIIANTNHVQ